MSQYLINRNQATRSAYELFKHNNDPVVYYVMPKGAIMFNHLQVQNKYSDYKPVSFKLLLKWITGSLERKQAVIDALVDTIDGIESDEYGNYTRFQWDLKRKINLYKEMIVQIQNLN